MKKQIKIIMLITSVAILTACGTAPEKEEAPKPPVTAAEAASAIMAADVAIGNAKQRKHLWRDTTKTLRVMSGAARHMHGTQAQRVGTVIDKRLEALICYGSRRCIEVFEFNFRRIVFCKLNRRVLN